MSNHGLSIRDRLFLIAHDDHHGFRSWIHPPTLGVGLAGAILIDLVLAGKIHIESGMVFITDPYDKTLVGDPITDQAFAIVRRHRPPRRHRDLITVLADDAYQRALGALIATGQIIHTRSWAGRSRYRPSDHLTITRAFGGAHSTVQRILANRENSREWNVADDALCVLIRVLRLHSAFGLGGTSDLDPALEQIT